jgi:RNA recognition motif-containing protein
LSCAQTLLSKKLKVDRETLVVDPRRSVFVGNLAFQLPDDQLRAYFNARLRSDDEPEPVENVRIVRDRESGMGKGFGYVLLKTSSLAAKALSLHETKLGTREIRVQVCGKRTKNRRGEETDPSKKHEGLRAAAGARARILLKRKSSSQGSEAAEAKRQKFAGTVKTIKPKHAARKARQAAEAAGAAGADGKKEKSSKRPRGDDKQGGGRNSKVGARPAKKAKVLKAKAQKPKHVARKARQAAEAVAKA